MTEHKKSMSGASDLVRKFNRAGFHLYPGHARIFLVFMAERGQYDKLTLARRTGLKYSTTLNYIQGLKVLGLLSGARYRDGKTGPLYWMPTDKAWEIMMEGVDVHGNR